MPDVAVGNIIKLVYYQRLYGQRVMNVFHYAVKTVAAGFDSMDFLAELLAKAATPSDTQTPLGLMMACQSNDLKYEQVRAQYVYPVPSVYRSESIATLEGDVEVEAGTANVAASITKKTDRFGRQGIGRVQLGGVPQSGYVAGLITNTYLNDLNALGDRIKTTVTIAAATASLDPCLFHQAPYAEDLDRITTCVAQNTVRDMRRRTVGLGE